MHLFKFMLLFKVLKPAQTNASVQHVMLLFKMMQ